MFGQQLYPTPDDVIRQMVAVVGDRLSKNKANYETTSILDPSAGSGAILKYINRVYKCSRLGLYAVEIDADLRYILQQNFMVVGTDFLSWSDPAVRFDFVIMNPPFQDGCKHVLHAWTQALADGGELVALVNTETIANPCSQERQLLLNLIAEHGTTQHMGRCFQKAERPTDVDVTMIHLTKPEAESFDFSTGNWSTRDLDFKAEEIQQNPLVASDAIESLLAQYNAAVHALVERDRAERQFHFLFKDIRGLVPGGVEGRDKCQFAPPDVSLMDRAIELRRQFWCYLFRKTKLGDRAPTKFERDFEAFQKSQGSMEFNRDNIMEVFSMLLGSYDQIMQECLIVTFDELTSLYEKNKVHFEGWKTNKGWKVNKKVIHPSYSPRYYSRWRSTVIEDLEKVLCWISGMSAEAIVTVDSLAQSHYDIIGPATPGNIETTFFHCKIFKKGTLHLTFKDLDLLAEFNRRAAIGKQWIGGEGF